MKKRGPSAQCQLEARIEEVCFEPDLHLDGALEGCVQVNGGVK